MKHSLKVTLFLLLLFLISQLIALFILNFYVQSKTPIRNTEGKIVDYNITYRPMPSVAGARIIEQPKTQEKKLGFLPILLAVIIGTLILFFLIKHKQFKIWRFWYFIAAMLCLFVAFYPVVYFVFMLLVKIKILHSLNTAANIKDIALSSVKLTNTLGIISFILALVISYLKVYKKHILIHNLSELFLYPGLIIIILPLFNIISILALLLIISIYDIIAVFKSKHMVTLAKGMLKQQMFAGLMVPYYKNKILLRAVNQNYKRKPKYTRKPSFTPKKKPKTIARGSKTQLETAILGGGDIAFPMLFNAVIYNYFANYALITILTSTLGLALLLFLAKKKRFYPAMPFITLGCILGYALILVLF